MSAIIFVDDEGNEVTECICRCCKQEEEAMERASQIQRSRIAAYTRTMIYILEDNLDLLDNFPDYVPQAMNQYEEEIVSMIAAMTNMTADDVR